MKTIQWLTSLERGKLVVAMLLVATASLFVQNQIKETQRNELQDKFRIELINRADSCEQQKMQIIQEANAKVEAFLRAQLRRSQNVERSIDSTVNRNSKLIKRSTNEVKRVRQKLLNQ